LEAGFPRMDRIVDVCIFEVLCIFDMLIVERELCAVCGLCEFLYRRSRLSCSIFC